MLTWLVRMESNAATDDTNQATLINDVLRKTSLLLNVCYSRFQRETIF